MSNIVIVWEMGSDLGHISRLKIIADELCQRGHCVTFILANPKQLNTFYGSDATIPFAIRQAPTRPENKVRLTRRPANLAEVLLANGFNSAIGLTNQLKAWRHVLQPLAPDIILFDYAPTALLATRDFSCVKIGIDSPFTAPPGIYPLPTFDADAKVSLANLKISEKKLVDTVNQSLAALQLPTLEYAHQIFQTHKSFLLSISELDPFASQRAPVDYIGGMIPQKAIGLPLSWRTGADTTKVFAYLKPSYPNLAMLLHVLALMKIEGRIFIPETPKSIRQIYKNSSLRISSIPFSLSQDLTESRFIICHGGHSTVLHSTMTGIPCLVIPLQQEQLATAKLCITSGFGLGLGPAVADQSKIAQVIKQLVTNDQYSLNAKACQNKYQTLLQTSTFEEMIDAIEQYQ